MSDSSDKEVKNPQAFGGEETKSEGRTITEGASNASIEYEVIVEGLVEDGRVVVDRVGVEKQSVSYRGEAYKEMLRNYVTLQAMANRVLEMPHTPEVGSSNQAGPSGSCNVVVASTLAGVDVLVGVPLPKRNKMNLYELEELKTDFLSNVQI